MKPRCLHYLTHQAVDPDAEAIRLVSVDAYFRNLVSQEAESSDDRRMDGDSFLVGPAFFDPQVNGFAGIDFQSPDLEREALEHAVSMMRKAGCSHLFLTLITNDPDLLTEQFHRIGNHIDKSLQLQKAILGFHLEGPFISAEPGYHGAHPREHASPPDIGLFEKWQKASGGRIRMVTLAPEWPGAYDFIRHARARNIFLAAGHTNPNLEQLDHAMRAGVELFTHLGNGCPQLLPRHENIIQSALSRPDLRISLIPDGIHIPPHALRNLIHAAGAHRIVFTTDAISAAGCPPGDYSLGGMKVRVGENRIVSNPNGGGLAGSSLTMIEGFYNAIVYGGLGVIDAWRGWTRLREKLFPEIIPPLIKAPFPLMMKQ